MIEVYIRIRKLSLKIKSKILFVKILDVSPPYPLSICFRRLFFGQALRYLMLIEVIYRYIYLQYTKLFLNIYIYTFIINTCSSMIQTMELITRALSAPSQPVLEDVDQTSRVVDRQICSENMIHQADLLMRKLTAEYMKEASRKDLVFIYYISFNA